MSELDTQGWGAAVIEIVDKMVVEKKIFVELNDLRSLLQHPVKESDFEWKGEPVSGGCGLIRFGRYLEHIRVAVKTGIESEMDMSHEIAKHYLIFKSVHGTGVHIPKIVGVNRYMLVTERIRKNKDQQLNLDHFMALVDFCQYMMTIGFEHGDMHVGNVIISEDDRLFVIDYGQPSAADSVVSDFISLKILFDNMKISTDIPSGTYEIVKTLFQETKTRLATTPVEEKKSLKSRFYNKIKQLLKPQSQYLCECVVGMGSTVVGFPQFLQPDSPYYQVAHQFSRLYLVTSRLDYINLAAWMLFEEESVLLSESFLRIPEETGIKGLLFKVSEAQFVLLDHLDHDSRGKEVYFHHDMNTNKVIVSIPLEFPDDCQPVDFALDFSHNDGLPWAKVSCIAISADGHERTVLEENLSFIVDNVTRELEVDYRVSMDVKRVALILPLMSCMQGFRVPSPLLSSFFDSVEKALLYYQSVVNSLTNERK